MPDFANTAYTASEKENSSYQMNKYPDLTSLNRNDLIKSLYEIIRILNVLQEKTDAAQATENEILELEKKGKKEAAALPTSWKIGIGIAAGVVFLLSIGEEDSSFLASLIVSCIMYFFIKLAIISPLYSKVICDKQVAAKYQAFANQYIAPRQAFLDQQLEDINAYLNSEECQWAGKALPQKYFTYPAILAIIEYLKSCRADSLKEALNLYEEEIHRQRMEEMQQQIAQSTAQSASEANRQSALLSDLQRTAKNTNTSVKIGNLINFFKD